MKIIFKNFLLILLAFISSINVYAAGKNCATELGIDPVDKVAGGSPPSQKLIYDLTYLTVKDNTLYLLGWAFNSGINQTSPDVKISFVPVGGSMSSSDKVDFTVIKATSGTANCGFTGCGGDPSKPKYYDLSYWNCFRQNVSEGNRCYQGSFLKLQGGFSAYIDLGKLAAGKKYEAWIKLGSFEKKLAIIQKHVDKNVLNNNTINIESESGLKKVEIKKTEFKNTVKMIAEYGRLMGSSGFHCNSVIADWGLDSGGTWFRWEGNNTFEIASDDQIQACRGGNDTCNHAAWGQYTAGDILMYHLKVNRSNVIGTVPDSWTNSSGSTAFAPASWLNFEGSISVEVKSEEPPPPEDGDPDEPGDPFTTDPNRCVGKDVYSVYYLLQHGLDDRKGVHDKSRSLNLIADKRILETVTGDPNKGFEWIETQGEGIVTVVNKATKESEMSLKEYFDRRYKGPFDKDLMYNEGNNYYVKHAYYQALKKQEDGTKKVVWRDSTTGCELTVTKGTNDNPEEFEIKDKAKCDEKKARSTESDTSGSNSLSWDEYKQLAIFVKSASVDTFEGNKQHNKNNGLVVERHYYEDKKYLIADPTRNVAIEPGTPGKLLQQPLVYRWDICLKDNDEPDPEIPDCSDDYEAASCEGDDGTSGYFHESDDMKTCTLSKNTDSGFLIVDEDYCTVGCKDDIDSLLPTYKYTKAGQFFILDNNIPYVKGTRTCVTSKIDYDKYDEDLKKQGDEMIKQYNTAKNYAERAEDFKPENVNIEEHKESKTLNTCCGGNCTGDDEAYAIFVKNSSSYNSLSDLTDKGKVIARYIHDTTQATYQFIMADVTDFYRITSGSLKMTDFIKDNKPVVVEVNINKLQDMFNKDEIDAVLIKVSEAKKLSGVRAIDRSGFKEETKEYTYKTWQVPAKTPKRSNSNVNPSDFAEKKGDYGGVSDISCQGDDLVETELGTDSFEEERKKMEAAAKDAQRSYIQALRAYKDVITTFNKCFSWTDKTPTVRNIGEDNYSIENARGGDNYEYKFDPDVTFSYDDPDSFVFGSMPLNYKTQKLNKKSEDDPEPTRYYWDRSTGEIDEKYSKDTPNVKTGYNDAGFSLEKRKYINCYGEDVCTENSTIEGDFYSNTSYIKRVEQISYTYHLPNIYTLVPSGKMSGSDIKPNIPMPDEAVPVNINTKEGMYDYYISINEISDKIRKEKSLTKETDTLEDRFNDSKALNISEEGYVCHYEVDNEIYYPPGRPGRPGGPNDLGQINFFYRPVDTYDISHPNNNPLGYNWADSRGQAVQERIKKDAMDYQELIKEEKGRFTFRLTPTVMKQIRYYNGEQAVSEENAFADFNLSCYDKGDAKGYHCYSPFLSCLASGGQNKEGADQTKIASCETIFKNTLNNYDSKYGYSELKRNRENLIKKQESLDRQEEVAE